MQPVYSLNLVNEVFEPELPGYYHYYSLVHQEHSDRVIEGLKLIFVELPKFTAHTYAEKRMQVLWLRFLTEIDEKTREVPEELRSEPDINKALTVLEESAFNDAELYQYEKFWDIIRVEKAIYRKGETVGMKRGMEKGLEQGIEQGIEKGIEQGLEQGIEKGIRQTAANMKRMGLDIESIVKCTGLTEEEILSL